MNYNIKKDKASVTANIGGDLTVNDNVAFIKLLALIFHERSPNYIVDLTALDTIDSTGLGMLLMVREKAKALGSTTELRGARGMVIQTLRSAKFDTMFSMT